LRKVKLYSLEVKVDHVGERRGKRVFHGRLKIIWKDFGAENVWIF
jgi:hypothetical protein